MTSEPDKLYAIAFADVAGSTKLYESVGDDEAKSLITSLQARIADNVTRMNGLVQEIVGDEVLYRFDDVDTCVACSCGIQWAAETFSADKGLKLSLRIGLHYGPAIIEDHKIYGDTINVAARVAAIARGGQIMATDAVVNNLVSAPRELARKFDEVRVKGKQDALVVYDLLWRYSNLTVASPGASSTAVDNATLMLRYNGQTYPLQPPQSAFTIGRNDSNDLVVDSDMASRQHATIERGRDHFVLIDSSTNGTYVQMQDGQTVFLRRESQPIWGRGQIGLGTAPEQGADNIIEFECS